MQDRLSELKNKRRSVGNPVRADAIEVEMPARRSSAEGPNAAPSSGLLESYDEVKDGIGSIEKGIERIKELERRSNKEVSDRVQQEIMKELDAVMGKCRGQAKRVKQQLDVLTAANNQYETKNVGSTSAQMRKNLLNTHVMHFRETMQDYEQASLRFKKALKDRICRQAKIVKDDITEKELDELIESDNPGQIFQKVMINDQLIDAVHEIEERHERMIKIEQGVREIHELFQDLAVLVDMQQETLDVIEQNVKDTAQYTEQGRENIVKAEEHAKNARRRTCYLIFILLVVLLVVILFLQFS